ncbi:MAG TPA: aldehyde dehydrogenase family protein [Syntrophorhabdaceae bacterium]|nr:aldehyde dehydrogenase family protein [Syntrophorhabdaceae bacterium]
MNTSAFPNESQIPQQYRLKKYVAQQQYLSGGRLEKWDGRFQKVYSPINEWQNGHLMARQIGEYPLLGRDQSLEALEAACSAFDNGDGPWPSSPLHERVAAVERCLSAMNTEREEISRMIMWEIGKNYRDSLKEFDRTIDYVRDTIRILLEKDQITQQLKPEQEIIGSIKRVPRGVVLCVGPYNYPLYETFTSLAPALLMGNTVLCKPPRFGALLFGPLLEIFRSCFPAGVINVLFGRGEDLLPPLLASGKIDTLAFIGTSATADHLKRLHPKQHRLKVVLGLEAKNPALILPDADLTVTCRDAALGALAFNGQRCAALKIFFVHSGIAKEFIEQFLEQILLYKCGMPWEDEVFVTPVADPNRIGYLNGLIRDAEAKGAVIMNRNGGMSEGNLFYPALLYPVKESMRIYNEEQFGPLIPVVPYTDIKEPLRYIQQSRFGQQASIFGNDSQTVSRVANVLSHQVSRININCKCQRTPDSFPFAGRKDSGEGILSVRDSLDVFSDIACIAARNTSNDRKLLDRIFLDK